MNLKDILSVSGKPGLYLLKASNRSSIIVESVEDGRKMPIHGAYKISALEDISIYTATDDIPLGEVFDKIHAKENGGKAIESSASEAEMRSYMEEILPDYDESRVYHSDLKKLFTWYNKLQEKDLLKPDEVLDVNPDDVVASIEDAEIISEEKDTSEEG